MAEQWAYEMKSEELMEALSRATVRAGISNSGLVIDLTGNNDGAGAFYLYGVVLSRLEGKLPPFKPGDVVIMDPKETYYCGPVISSSSRHHASGEAAPNVQYEVAAIYYEKVHRAAYRGGEQRLWTLRFNDKAVGECRFTASRFLKVGQAVPAAA
jgi:hypothetical protein